MLLLINANANAAQNISDGSKFYICNVAPVR